MATIFDHTEGVVDGKAYITFLHFIKHCPLFPEAAGGATIAGSSKQTDAACEVLKVHKLTTATWQFGREKMCCEVLLRQRAL